jgi:DNA-binding MarR family transcriptional regulator
VQIGPELNHTVHEMRRTLDAYISALAGDEVTGMRGMVLGYIVRRSEEGGSVYQRDIEAKFHTRRSSVTTMLQGMEQTGLIERQAVKSDARLKQLLATPKGMACHEKIHVAIKSFETALQQGLTEAEIAELLRLLGHLRQNLDSMKEQSA